MSGKNDRKIRKEVKNVYVKAQGVLYDEIKKDAVFEKICICNDDYF